ASARVVGRARHSNQTRALEGPNVPRQRGRIDHHAACQLADRCAFLSEEGHATEKRQLGEVQPERPERVIKDLAEHTSRLAGPHGRTLAGHLPRSLSVIHIQLYIHTVPSCPDLSRHLACSLTPAALRCIYRYRR